MSGTLRRRAGRAVAFAQPGLVNRFQRLGYRRPCQLQRPAAAPAEPQSAVAEATAHRLPGLVHLAQPVLVPPEFVDDDANLRVIARCDKSLVLRLGQSVSLRGLAGEAAFLAFVSLSQ